MDSSPIFKYILHFISHTMGLNQYYLLIIIH
jgi:hypothetical protein